MALEVTPDSNKTHAYSPTTHTSIYLYEDSETQIGILIRIIYRIMFDLCKHWEKKNEIVLKNTEGTVIKGAIF